MWKEVLRKAREEKDRRGVSLLERARETLLTGSLYRYNATEHSCTCPYRTRTGKTCKHMVAVTVLRYRGELEKSSEWRAFFRLYDEKLRKDVEIFSCF